MPQTTIFGYFAPVQTSPVRTWSQAELQLKPSTCASNIVPKDMKPELSTTERELHVGATIRQRCAPEAFSGTDIDFFVPKDQPQAAIVKVIPSYTARLKNITRTLLPIRYPDKFYNECLEDDIASDLSRVLLWNSQPVGWIRCRLEDDEQGCKQIYVQALGVLAPYRGRGLATNLLEQVTQPILLQRYDLSDVYCHVWESNMDALEWYERRGFKRVVLIEQYYRRLRPAGAWIMRKELA